MKITRAITIALVYFELFSLFLEKSFFPSEACSADYLKPLFHTGPESYELPQIYK